MTVEIKFCYIETTPTDFDTSLENLPAPEVSFMDHGKVKERLGLHFEHLKKTPKNFTMHAKVLSQFFHIHFSTSLFLLFDRKLNN